MSAPPQAAPNCLHLWPLLAPHPQMPPPRPTPPHTTSKSCRRCGFCTPGFVMSMYSLLRSKTEPPTEEEIEECLAGNLW